MKLTDKTLEELGFVLINDHLETVWRLNNPYIELHPNGDSHLFLHSGGTALVVNTISGVKLLIEALNGNK